MCSMDGTFLIDNEHRYGGMVKDMCLEELNAPPFFILKTVKIEKLWKMRGRSARHVPSLNPPIPCPLSSINLLFWKTKRATY